MQDNLDFMLALFLSLCIISLKLAGDYYIQGCTKKL
jgi:hypothetical protein